MGIGCDHLLSGRGRGDYALLRYLVLLTPTQGLCQLHVGCALTGRSEARTRASSDPFSLPVVDPSPPRSTPQPIGSGTAPTVPRRLPSKVLLDHRTTIDRIVKDRTAHSTGPAGVTSPRGHVTPADKTERFPTRSLGFRLPATKAAGRSSSPVVTGDRTNNSESRSDVNNFLELLPQRLENGSSEGVLP
jgi:hypothetical protein